MAETGAASRAKGKDDRSNQRAAKEGETRSAVSEPSSQQRVSVKAVKGGGKEKEDFLKKILFSGGLQGFSRSPCRSSVLPLTAGAFSLRYNGKS